ncbi:MAG: MFS transporter [Christensenellales bacterium]
MNKIFGRYRGLPREIYVLFFARVINSIGAYVFPLLTLILTDKLGFSDADAGMFITILMLTQGPAMLLGGKLADKFGRLKLMIVFQFLGALTYIVCGFMELSHAVVYLIVLASNFFAMTYPAMDAMTADLTHPGNRKEAYALLYMGFNLGFAFGPMIGGLLYKNFLQLIFWGDAITTILSLVLILAFVKETLPQKNDKTAPQTDEGGLEQYEEGSVFRVLLKRKVLLLYALILFVFEFSYQQWSFGLPLQMQALFADGAAKYGLVASLNGFLVILLTPFVSFIMQRWRALRGMALAGLLFAVAFGLLIFIKDLAYFYVFVVILTFGEVFSTIDSRTYLANHSPASHRGRLNSLVNIIGGLGRSISPLIVGRILTSGGLTAGWTTVSIVALCGAVGVLMLCGYESRSRNRSLKMK